MMVSDCILKRRVCTRMAAHQSGLRLLTFTIISPLENLSSSLSAGSLSYRALH